MKNSQKLWTSVSNSLGRQTPKTTLPQLIMLVSLWYIWILKKTCIGIRSIELSIIFRLFGVCVPKATCCLKGFDHLSSLSADVDLEVLRRDICCDLDRDDLSELRNRDHVREGPQTRLSHPDGRPGETVRHLVPSTGLNNPDSEVPVS